MHVDGDSSLYLHDGLSEVLGTPVTQSRLEGGTDVAPVTTRLVAIFPCLEYTQAKIQGVQLDKTTPAATVKL